MLTHIRNRVSLFGEKFGEAWLACALAMMQGDLTVMTIEHAMRASKTGALTGSAIVVASLLPIKSKYASVWLTGVFTALAEAVQGTNPMMSLGVGGGAMLLTVVFQRIIRVVR